MKPDQRRRTALWIAGALAGFVLLLYFPLLFTNRVLANGDILLYFYPYRDYAAASLRQGQVPFWNPYIFLGAPFLANPQAAVLYPMHWPLSWLPVTKQIYWSAAIHTWLLGFGGYLLMRRWGASAWAGLTCGLVLAGSGFYGGMIGHLNQMNAAAWLPWALWILDRATTSKVSRSSAGFGVIVALMLLAGHAQTAFINLCALGVWLLWLLYQPLRTNGYSFAAFKAALSPLWVYAGGTVLGLLISAAQLLPTLELSSLGLRSGGLSYAEVTSFSLKPLHLLWTLLPSYGLISLEAHFATPAYSEYIAYVGLTGLLLALIGGWQGRGTARSFGILFAALGFLLALGRWNPLYFVLYWIVPGFDLFRNPARWMLLYTLGLAVLAGVGVDWLRTWREPGDRSRGVGTFLSKLPARGLQQWTGALTLLIAIDLLIAAQALPHAQTTAPQAVTDLRTAPAHLLTDRTRAALGPAAMGRFLGMSTITYDPGDMADWQRILQGGDRPQLDEQAFGQFVIALKVQELIVPNLSLLWRIPSVDGFDGGVLPLQRYNEFLTLFVPREELVPDGRLREQLRTVPSTALLNLLNVQYLITDKVRDLWFEDVFYDRQIGARLDAARRQVALDVPNPLAATHVDLIGFVDGDEPRLQALANQTVPVAEVIVHGADESANFPLTAGGAPGAQLADGALDSALAQQSGATIAYRDVEGGRQEYRVRLALPAPTTPVSLTVQLLDESLALQVQAVTLYDARTKMFVPLLPSDRGRFRLVHSGDVKIYENLDVLPRAYLAHTVIGAADSTQALATLRSTAPLSDTAVVEGLPGFTSQPAPTDQAQIITYTPERVEIAVQTTDTALLVLSDTAYPGWTATVDGATTPLYTTNYLFRGVSVPPGAHTVTFTYSPSQWQWGLWLSGIGVGLTVMLAAWTWPRRSRSSKTTNFAI